MCILECICIGAWGVSKREVVCVIIKARCLLVRPLRIALWVSAWFRIREYACRTPYSSTSAARISVPMTFSHIVLCRQLVLQPVFHISFLYAGVSESHWTLHIVLHALESEIYGPAWGRGGGGAECASGKSFCPSLILRIQFHIPTTSLRCRSAFP